MFPRPFSGQYSAYSVDCYREKDFFLLRQPQAARGTSAWLSVDANLLANSGSSTQLDARIPRQTQGPSRRVSNVDVPQPNPSPPYHPALFMSVFRRQPPSSNPSPTPAQGPSTHTPPPKPKLLTALLFPIFCFLGYRTLIHLKSLCNMQNSRSKNTEYETGSLVFSPDGASDGDDDGRGGCTGGVGRVVSSSSSWWLTNYLALACPAGARRRTPKIENLASVCANSPEPAETSSILKIANINSPDSCL